jgi:hypothetical protein
MNGFSTRVNTGGVSKGATGAIQKIDSLDARQRSRRALLVATLVSIALMFVPYSDYLLYPIRLFVTFVHESGHALATLITGGNVQFIRIKPDTSGVTLSQSSPWAQWLIDSGGYLGATLFGAILLQTGRLNRWRDAGRATLYAMALYMLTITVLWTHNPFQSGLFTPAMGLLITALLWAAARFATPRTAEFLAAFLAVQCCLNALIDLRVLFAFTTGNLGDNDAKFMSNVYGLPPTFWAVLWAIMALVILSVSLASYWRGTAKRA